MNLQIHVRWFCDKKGPVVHRSVLLSAVTMVLVSSAILGAAAGTGLALVVAVTIVTYRYYLAKRQCKEWAELEEGRERNRIYAREIYVQVRYYRGLL